MSLFFVSLAKILGVVVAVAVVISLWLLCIVTMFYQRNLVVSLAISSRIDQRLPMELLGDIPFCKFSFRFRDKDDSTVFLDGDNRITSIKSFSGFNRLLPSLNCLLYMKLVTVVSTLRKEIQRLTLI